MKATLESMRTRTCAAQSVEHLARAIRGPGCPGPLLLSRSGVAIERPTQSKDCEGTMEVVALQEP
jgi:hypothetical protein